MMFFIFYINHQTDIAALIDEARFIGKKSMAYY